jgi:hypothetical protein
MYKALVFQNNNFLIFSTLNRWDIFEYPILRFFIMCLKSLIIK